MFRSARELLDLSNKPDQCVFESLMFFEKDSFLSAKAGIYVSLSQPETAM